MYSTCNKIYYALIPSISCTQVKILIPYFY